MASHLRVPGKEISARDHDGHLPNSQGEVLLNGGGSTPPKGWRSKILPQDTILHWDWEKTGGRERPPSQTPPDHETLPSLGAD